MKKFLTNALLCTFIFQYVAAQENIALGDWSGKEFSFEFDIQCDCTPIQKDSLKSEFKPYLEKGLDLAVILSDLYFEKNMHVTGNLMQEDIDGEYRIEADTIIVQNNTKTIKLKRFTAKRISQIEFYTTKVKENPSVVKMDGIGDVIIQPISFSFILEKDADLN